MNNNKVLVMISSLIFMVGMFIVWYSGNDMLIRSIPNALMLLIILILSSFPLVFWVKK